ncbi:box C/D snoRNA protein 1 isoform X2 [Octodon degus]|uniref:Box C/D snoRNA protein 1 n=1 Tax=Octodon degus TaxID=10160 RepID=A0A6P6D405_OCTDE|nr:box C/D snoRNA protein 1 isoform X2 [Octodon degus]
MAFATENEGDSGEGLQRVPEGARLEPGREVEAGDPAGMEAPGGGEHASGRRGVKMEDAEEGSEQRAVEMRVDSTVVKLEGTDWSDVDGGVWDAQWEKREAEDGAEVEEEKAGVVEVRPEAGGTLVVKEEKMDGPDEKEEKVEVKEEVTEEVMDWPEVKEEEGSLEMEQEMFVDQSMQREEMMDGVRVKEEGLFLKEEVTEDVKVEEELQINPPVGSKRKLAMSRCETCGTEEAKYKCPRCMRYSCSLPCVKKHKAELMCNGVRDKTAYVSIQQFTEMNLLSDYRFLEDVARTADHISRDALLRKPISNKYMYFMKNRARRQGITLKLLPNGFTKRKENSTFFDKRKQQFCWHVKLQFPQSQAEYIEKRVPDDKTINEILKPYIDPEKSDPVIRQRLKVYIHSQTSIQILMKVENMQQNIVSEE